MPTVLVTGANRGIGLSLVRQYADEGWSVIATCRDPDGADALRALGGDVRIEKLEVVDRRGIAALADKLGGQPIDVLFNNAGIAGREAGTLGSIDADVWMHTLEVNTVAPILLCEALRANVAASGQKKIAFVSSRLGSIGSNTWGDRYAYSSSKAALNMAGKSLSLDTANDGITVVMMHPGHVRTDMGGASAPVTPEESAAGMRRVVAEATTKDSGRFFNYDGSEIPW